MKRHVPSPGELLDLQASVAERTRLEREITAAREAHGTSGRGLPARLGLAGYPLGAWVPASSLAMVGHATPLAALESFLCAGSNADVERLEELTELGSEAQARADSLFAGLPERAQREYGTPLNLVALLLAKDAPVEGLQVVAALREDEDHFSIYSGTDTRYDLHRSSDGWRISVAPSTIDHFALLLSGQGDPESLGVPPPSLPEPIKPPGI
jgi:hypothetical protein